MTPESASKAFEALVARALHETTGEAEAQASAMAALKTMRRFGGRVVFNAQADNNHSTNQSNDNARHQRNQNFWENFEREVRAKAQAKEAELRRQEELRKAREKEQREYEAQVRANRQARNERNNNIRRMIANKFPGYCCSCKMACGKGAKVHYSWSEKNIQCDWCFSHNY